MALLVVTRTASTPYSRGFIQGIKYTVTVDEAQGIPSEIFVFLKLPDPTESGDMSEGYEFQNIASPDDLEEYPVNTPAPGGNRPFFRMSAVELRFRSVTLAEDTWKAIQQDIRALLQAWEDSEVLGSSETVTFGESSSSSSGG